MDEHLPKVRNIDNGNSYRDLGGLFSVSGWMPEPGNLRDLVVKSLNDDGIPSSFDSLEEVVHFMRGAGEYKDKNSFFLTQEDQEMQSSEGYFAGPYCGKCVDDFIHEAVEADPLDADLDLDAEVSVFEREEEVNSFRPGYSKFVDEVRYACLNHPEVSISRRDIWYEEN